MLPDVMQHFLLSVIGLRILGFTCQKKGPVCDSQELLTPKKVDAL